MAYILYSKFGIILSALAKVIRIEKERHFYVECKQLNWKTFVITENVRCAGNPNKIGKVSVVP